MGALEEGIDEKDVPQDIKDEITQIQEDQREKLRQTMLQTPMKKKTTALKNLTNMFEQYPVVTNESQKLKMEVISEIKDDGVVVDGMNCKQQLYSRLLTSINPFAQFVIREQIELGDNYARKSKKHWVLDEAIFAKSEYKPKKEHLWKTSSEMFSIYIYVKDPMMEVKSDKYTNGEFKKVKDLISIEDSLLVSSQMSNSLLQIEQYNKLMQDASK